MDKVSRVTAVASSLLICGCTSVLETSPLHRPGNNGSGGSATVTGTVVGVVSLSPLADASVTVAGKVAHTGASGAFVIVDVPAGENPILIESDDYDHLLSSITVADGQNDLGQFALTPAAHLKTIVVMDRSNSMNFTDRANARLTALGDLVDSLKANDSRLKTGYEMALVSFWGGVAIHTHDAAGNPGFTNDVAALRSSIAEMATTSSNTGYTPALATAFDLVDAHSAALSGTEKARARYEIVFVSDGMPYPDNCPGEANSATAALQQVEYITDLAVARGVALRLHTTALVHEELFRIASPAGCVGATGSHTMGWGLTTLLSDMAIAGGGLFRYFADPAQMAFDQPLIEPAVVSTNPVKIMFVVDNSGSMQFTDPSRRLAATVQGTMGQLRGTYPGATYGGIVMTAETQPVIDFGACEVFADSPPDIAAEMLSGDMSMTDMQGALNVTRALLEKDMQRVARRDVCPGGSFPAADELARTRYVVVVLSAGDPGPQCQAGPCNDIDPSFPSDPTCQGATTDRMCEDQDSINCLLKENDGAAPDVSCSGGICDYNGVACFDQPSAGSGLFGGFPGLDTELAAGGNYNQPWQVEARSAQVAELAATYGVGEVVVHSVLLYPENELPAAVRAIFGENGPALMESVAQAAGGLYVERHPSELSLSDLDFSPLP